MFSAPTGKGLLIGSCDNNDQRQSAFCLGRVMRILDASASMWLGTKPEWMKKSPVVVGLYVRVRGCSGATVSNEARQTATSIAIACAPSGISLTLDSAL